MPEDEGNVSQFVALGGTEVGRTILMMVGEVKRATFPNGKTFLNTRPGMMRDRISAEFG